MNPTRTFLLLSLLLVAHACTGGRSASVSATASLSTSPGAAGDLSEVQRALNDAPRGSTVTIPAGTFAGRLVVVRSVVLEGAGDATELRGVPGLGDAAIEVRGAADVTIRDLKVSAPRGGVRVRDSVGVTIERVRASGNGNEGIDVRSSAGVLIRDCDVVDNVGYGVRSRDGSQGVRVENCLVSGSLDHGVEVRDTTEFTLSTSVVRENVQSGVRLEDSSLVSIVDNDIEANGEYGVRVRGADVDIATLADSNRIVGNVRGSVRVD